MKQNIIITDYQSVKHNVSVDIVQEGFTDVYGFTWSKSQIKQYNKLSVEIAQMKYCNSSRVELAISDRHRIYHMPLYMASRPIIDSQNLSGVRIA